MLALALACLRPAWAAGPEADWATLSGRHVVVQHRNQPVLAETLRVRAEALYKSMCRDLGMTRRTDFWLGDRRATIVLYTDLAEFQRATGSPAWAAGRANPGTRRIELVGVTIATLESDLAHELAHLVFRDYVATSPNVPLWLDEGVAQWLSRPDPAASVSVGLAARIPLVELTGLRAADLPDTGEAITFYQQAASLVEFLVTTQGPARSGEFCRHLRDGRSLADALRFTYPHGPRTIDLLEQTWLSWLDTTRRRAERPGGGSDDAEKRIHVD